MTAPLRAIETALRPFVGKRVPPGDVDDVLQEVLVRLHRSAGTLRDEARLRPWLYQVTRRAISDYRRARRRSPLAESPHEEPAAVAAEPDEPDVLAEQLAALMPALVAELPSPYREALTLTELEGLTQAEAAAQLGIGLSAMKSRVQRGRAKLRERLERCCAIALDSRNRVTSCEPLSGWMGLPSCCVAPEP